MGWFVRTRPRLVALPATVDDLAEIARIHAQGFWRGWSVEEIDTLLATPGALALVARLEGRGERAPLGFVVVRVAGDEAEVIMLSTDARARRSGVGRMLMAEVIRTLHAQRVKALLLEVNEDNTAALGLYRSMGFAQVGRRPAYYASQARAGAPAPAALVLRLDLR